MSKKAGIAIMALGAVLMISALLLFSENRREDIRAGQDAESLLARVEAAVVSAPTEIPSAPTEPTLAPELPVVVIDGYGYVGYLQIPALELTLPVMDQWDYGRLKKAPCRQLGSSRTGDLVIAAHNYSTHFGKLKKLVAGDAVIFTDMDHITNTYAVAEVRTVDPEDVEAVVNSGYPLVLYTCTPGGKTRVAVFCQQSEE